MTAAEHKRLNDRIKAEMPEPEPIDFMVAVTEYRRCRRLMRDPLHAIATR